MPISNTSLPTVPDGLYVDNLRLDADGLQFTIRTTALHLVRRRPLPPCPAPRVMGNDEEARPRGRCYGAIVCDLERRRVVDLLPGRFAQRQQRQDQQRARYRQRDMDAPPRRERPERRAMR